MNLNGMKNLSSRLQRTLRSGTACVWPSMIGTGMWKGLLCKSLWLCHAHVLLTPYVCDRMTKDDVIGTVQIKVSLLSCSVQVSVAASVSVSV
jgi:hypothetical protein